MSVSRLETQRFTPFHIYFSLLFVSLFAVPAFSQTQSCAVTANATLVHREGLAERTGDLNLSCTGGQAGSNIAGSLFVSLNTNITNRLDSNGIPQGIVVTVNSGGGAVAIGSVRMTSGSAISITALNYAVPAVPAAPVTITISGIRAAIATLSNASGPSVVSATVQGVGTQSLSNTPVNVAISAPGLLQSLIDNGVPCLGSPMPASLDLPSFAAISNSSTVRVTEASAAAFAKKQTGDDSGVRILVRLSGYGSGVRAFVPDAIVGNDGTTPTSAGAFGVPVGAGVYTPGSGQLLLVRVNGADANGAGGTLATTQPLIATSLAAVSEVSVSNGSAVAVYEVVDSNASVIESAQIPVFISVNQTSCPSNLTPSITASLAPVSTVSVATATDPIPRFLATPPASDCAQLNDCGASYYPSLSVDATPVTLLGSSSGNKQSAFVRVGNTGAGMLYYTTSVNYQSGAGWLSVNPPSGVNNGVLQVIADPANLQPGTYKASVVVNGGSYGSATVPVTFTVGAAGVTITNVGNAASFQYGTVAPGSYAVVYGLNLAGKDVSVTFNGLPASIVYDSSSQINLIVPAALGGQQGAAVIARVDGSAGNTFTVKLNPNMPGIFNPGIVNFADGTVNSADHPAKRGDFVSVYLTGLAVPVSNQVTVNIDGQMNLVPSFAGAQPILPALDQVNITVPLSLPATPNPVSLRVCVPGDAGQPICSNQVNLFIR